MVAAPATHGAAATRHGWTPPKAEYPAVVKQHDVRVRMDDGVMLDADIVRPSENGKTAAAGTWPVIIGQTPYNKNTGVAGLTEENDYLIEHGYMEVLVDVRGTGSSEGTWSSFGPREQKDYGEVARWARGLPGSDGKLAVYGTSYGGIDALLTAEDQPKGLKAAFPIIPMGDAYRDVTANGGDIDTGFIPFWLGLVTATSVVPSEDIPTDPTDALEAETEHLLGVTSFQAPTILNAEVGGSQAFDTAFYKERSPLAHIDRDKVPTFIVGGEQDLFQRGEPMLYNAIRANHVPARLLIGPWTHTAAGEGEGLPEDGVPVLSVLALRWFNHYVKGIPDPTLDTDIAPVTVWRLGSGSGSGTFDREQAFPAPDTRYRALRLQGTKTMPYAPVAGVCSESLSQWTAGLVPDNVPCADGQYLNDRLGAYWDFPVTGKQPFRFDGTSMARLFVSTTGSDASLTVRLEDVGPNGAAVPITNGWQVLALRKLVPAKSAYADGRLVQPWHPDTKASMLPVKKGHVYEVDVEIFPTTAQVAPGHRLRVSIQTADEPHLTPPVGRQAGELTGTTTIYASKKFPSALILGVQ